MSRNLKLPSRCQENGPLNDVRWVVNVQKVQEDSGPLHLLGSDEEPVEVVVSQAVILESGTSKKRSTK